ncbi:MAG: phosphoribosylanthranilate isomerase [Rhodospirillaceae bacterium]|nr:phosphoribosylanthranilate isomerase [Rhodospirillaceae bacterium]
MPPNANSPNIEVKICGLASPESVDVAVEGGARYVGFVFYPPSPRNLKPAEARSLTERVPLGVHRVALFVNPSDTDIDRVFAQNQFDMIQLHGAETPERTNNIRARTGTKVMKVIKLAARADLAAAAAYQGAADQLLFDAMAPKDRTDALPGGNALAFDWTLLAGAEMALPWMLAGGLTAENLAQAVASSGASQVDVSSGVEDAPGVKSPDKICAFLAAAAAI